MKKVAMIGVGKLGQDCAEVMAAAGYDVAGYDVAPRTPVFPYMVGKNPQVTCQIRILIILL